ncbi:similar to multidrug resistance protein [Plenodomus lingam JN3]|uniref:Similar to multidrug resistance protein n=1 Tax=Leptosphaeria maculans (strain JN3 / isolate v23.1.3 / race Av1-4-5-6-7-8) TaxID=985895 RepID=E4ZU39_LEPMJ|nr:similar to multidrug resistance protein [Plenodomus lingam JN3]CBX94749.1 similar to multidrug resistance protein [Plenodomus lingam JN3]
MTYLVKHSSVGTAFHYIKHRKFDFSRQPGKAISASSSTDDLPFPETRSTTDEDATATGTELKQHQTSLADWSGPDDPSNPKNWPMTHKVVMTVLLCTYTFAVYVGSSIYSSSQEAVVELFGVTHVEGSLGMALYVLGYGIGCLLFSPLSEVPAIGRNPPYAVSGFLFVILCIPTALVNNFAGLMVLRFLLGFMASPCLATAGASLGDIWTMAEFPFAVALWAAVATLGPALGPTLSSFAVKDLGWRFSSWELLIISGPIYLLMLFFVPESSSPTILYYKAKRMREETGNMSLMSDAERKQASLQVGQLLFDALVKPWEINALDPAILFTTVYMGLCYGIYYSFFESLPLVYPVYYNFTAESTSLIFLAILPACVIAFSAYVLYLKYRVFPRLTNGTFGEVENHLLPGMAASPLIVIGLFIFAWTARPSVHWMAPTFGLGLTIFGIYFIAQSVLLYIPNIYPRYAASIFSANSLSRSAFAFAAILFARPMFQSKMGIDGGVSLLAGCMVLCTLGIFGLFRFGKGLRERSRFAVG